MRGRANGANEPRGPEFAAFDAAHNMLMVTGPPAFIVKAIVRGRGRVVGLVQERQRAP